MDKDAPFTKYEEDGAYHWVETDPQSRQYNPPLEARYRVVVKRVRDAGSVLEVGCGDGYLMSLLSPRSQAVAGVDSDATAAALATHQLRSFPNCFVARASCYELPWSDASFDVVVMADVIEHLVDPRQSVAEARRVLRPGGRLLVTTPKWRPDRKWDERHVIEFKPDELSACLRGAFRRVKLTFFWPLRWSNFYRTKVGWRAVRVFARHIYNPFVGEGLRPERFGQILAECE